ncbi:flagellar hook-length control protein FliK [Pseudomonas sp. LB3P14]
MDIIASLTATSAVSTQASASSQAPGTTSESFSSVLSQVSEAPMSKDSANPTAATGGAEAQTDAADPSAEPPASTPAPSVVDSAVETATRDSVAVDETDLAPTLPSCAMSGVIPEAVELPAPAVSAPTTPSLSQPLASTSADPDASLMDDNLGLDLYTTADDLVADADLNASDSSSDVDSSLEDIRQRMALIESAGQLDTFSMVVAPAAPLQIQITSQDVVPADPDTLIRANTNLPASSLTSADTNVDANQDTCDPLDVQDTVQTLTGTVADAVQDLRTQTDSTPVDSQADGSVSSDVQSSYSLAPMTLNNTALTGNDNVSSNALVLATAVGTVEWQNGLGQQMIDMVTRGEQQVDLRLNPIELGPLSISLNLNDGNTQAQFQSAHASVRAAVEQALPQLREALASQGISLGQASVSDESARQTSGDQARRDSQGNRADALMSSTDSVPEVDQASVQSIVVRSSGVDLYV